MESISGESDYLVVGSGPNGILISSLLLSQGKRVTLIEAGGEFEESSLLNLNSYRFESKSKLPKSAHMLGGGSNHWLGRVGQFIESDFMEHPNRNASWPLNFQDLDPYFKKVFLLMLNSQILDYEFVNNNLAISVCPVSIAIRIGLFLILSEFISA